MIANLSVLAAHVSGTQWALWSVGAGVFALIAVIALGVVALKPVETDESGESSSLRKPWSIARYSAMVAVALAAFALVVAFLVFVLPGRANGVGTAADHRFILLGHLLKGMLLLLIASSVVSVSAALILRAPKVRRAVRRYGQRLRASSAGQLHRPGARIKAIVGSGILWLSDSSLQVQDFRGELPDIDPKGVSSALAGFLADIGSLTAIGPAGPLDPRLEIAPFRASTMTQDLAQALSDAPYGKAAGAVLSLARRLVPRDQLYVGGYLLHSAQRGIGVTMTLATADGGVVDTETIWVGDFEPAALPAQPGGATVSAPLALALASAVWVTYALARRSGQRDLKVLFETDVWQSYALVRVGLQGTKRGSRLTRAIYARAVDLDPHNHTAIFNLGLAELRSAAETGSPELAETATERLEMLYADLIRPLSDDSQANGVREPLRLPLVFNMAVEALNEAHRAGDDRPRRP